MSPTVHREGPFRFFFFSNEGGEPPHIHVACRDGEAKVWIISAEFAAHAGIKPPDLARILTIANARRSDFLEAWYGHFGTPR